MAKATKSEDAEVKQRALRIIKQIEKQFEKEAIAYFKKLEGKVNIDGGWVTVGKHPLGKPVIRLSLCNTKITDAGLVHLRGLTNLQKLYLGNTKVTEAGVENLRKALPKCEINYGCPVPSDASFAP